MNLKYIEASNTFSKNISVRILFLDQDTEDIFFVVYFYIRGCETIILNVSGVILSSYQVPISVNLNLIDPSFFLFVALFHL